jgi:threonine synthase
MQYRSLNQNAPAVSFQEAVINGLAPDKGLYFPTEIPKLDAAFLNNLENLSNEEIAFTVIQPFVNNEIPDAELQQIVAETLCFDFPTVAITSNIFSLELYHGPTMAFKDVGARFMARCLAYFNKNNPGQKNTILVATSGDTGGAVADGFLGVTGVEVVILYPSGKVSDVQEKQLTTLGQNISAVEVNGVFDDCQEMVKKAFLDVDLTGTNLTSANSINIARWLPQMFYFFFAYKQLKKHGKKIVFSVPSGNFGNICSGIVAKKMGLPIHHFIAATNGNDTVPRFMKSGSYEPKPSIATLSNAMDVGNPSNFIRIQELYANSLEEFKKDFTASSYSDNDAVLAMKELYSFFQYISEPHGAIGYLGLKEYLDIHPETIGVFLETAHPIKFKETVESTLKVQLQVPSQIERVMHQKKVSHPIETYEQLKSYLLHHKVA